MPATRATAREPGTRLRKKEPSRLVGVGFKVELKPPQRQSTRQALRRVGKYYQQQPGAEPTRRSKRRVILAY